MRDRLMPTDVRPTESDLIGARALREWITGERSAYSRVFVVEDGAATACLDGVAVQGDAVLLPAGGESYEGPADAVPYTGALAEIGDELFFGERGVELQDYVAAAFVQIIGPTAVCLLDASGWQAFLDDADLARETGVFPSALIDPWVLLADRGALMRPTELTTPSTVRVRSDGRVSVGIRGEIIGDVDDLSTLLAIPRPGVAALDGVAPREKIVDDLNSREWIGRYLGATDLMKMLKYSNGAAKILGFGWSLVDDELADAEPLASEPFLLETADGLLLADTITLRRQLLSPVTAAVVGVTQTSSTLELAAERVARQIGMPEPEAKSLCVEAVAALNIRLGGSADSSQWAKGSDG
jgi:hypothetical protein